MGRNIYLDNIELSKAKKIWNNGFKLQSRTEIVDVRESLGKITAQAVFSNLESPHYRASAMDGIAVKAETTAQASERNPILLASEQYELIDTGEPVTDGYDAVIMIENVNFKNDKAQIEKAVVPGHNIRQAGESLKKKQLMIPGNKKIIPYDIGLALEGAVNEVEVYTAPKVRVIPTGTELIEFKSEPAPGEIIESNSYVLSNLAKGWGADSSRSGIVEDDYQLIKEEVKFAVEKNDFVAVIAGSSAGREDYTADIIAELGEVLVHGVSISPGGPVILGVIDETPVIGVPGYPVAAALTFRLFARPIILELAGHKNLTNRYMKANLAVKVVSKLGFREFLRVKLADLKGEVVARPLTRSAGVMGSLTQADGLAQIDENSEGLKVGSEIKVEIIKETIKPEAGLFISGAYNQKLDQLKNLYKQQGFELTLFEQGSKGGLVSLGRGESHLAGVYLPQNFNDYSYLQKFSREEFMVLPLFENIDFAATKIKQEQVITEGEKEFDKLKYELIIPKSLLKDKRIEELKAVVERI